MIPPVRKKWSLSECTLRDLIVLCAQMRPDEIEQYLALTGAQDFSFERAASAYWNTPGIKFTLLGPDGLPLVAGGFEPVRPGVYHSWMTGTMAAWETHWRSITEATNFLMDCMMEDGAVRIQTHALAKRVGACKWYEKGLKMQREGVLRRFSSTGEDVVVYSRVAPRLADSVNEIAEEVPHGRWRR